MHRAVSGTYTYHFLESKGLVRERKSMMRGREDIDFDI